MKRIFPLLGACLLVFGCSRSDSPRYEAIALEEARLLSGTVLGEPIRVSGVVDQRMMGDYIVMVCLHPEYRCILLDKQGKIVSEFCPVGKGPGEAVVVMSVEPGERAGEVCVYDPQMQKQLFFSLDSLVGGSSYAFRGEKSRQESGDVPMNQVWNLRRVESGLLFVGGNGIISSQRPERFVLTDRTGTPIGRFGDVPPGEDTIAMKVAFMQSRLTVSPDGTKLADGSSFGAILETFDLRDSIRLRSRAYFIEPDFPHDEVGRITAFDRLTFGFGAMASSDDRIYAVYNGTSDAKAMCHVAVFDWEGRLERLYKTQGRVAALCVDPDSANLLYAAVEDEAGEFRLVRFDLPE